MGAAITVTEQAVTQTSEEAKVEEISKIEVKNAEISLAEKAESVVVADATQKIEKVKAVEKIDDSSLSEKAKSVPGEEEASVAMSSLASSRVPTPTEDGKPKKLSKR